MRKLLSANFSRLWKSKIFWLLEAATFSFSAIAYFLVGANVKNMGESWILSHAEFYFFIVLVYVGVLIAIFSSQFFGTEYSDGTVRNKMVVGHSRKAIYFSCWLLNAFVTVLFILTHYIVAIIVGIPVGGIAVISVIEQIGLKIACSLIIALAYTAIFTMTTLLDSNKARCAVVNILLIMLLMIVGFMIFSALEQPELKYQMVLQDDGSYLMHDNIPNPRYVGGSLRIVYTVIESIMPAAFALRLVSNCFSSYHIIGCTALFVLLTAAGMALFKKKDIK